MSIGEKSRLHSSSPSGGMGERSESEGWAEGDPQVVMRATVEVNLVVEFSAPVSISKAQQRGTSVELSSRRPTEAA